MVQFIFESTMAIINNVLVYCALLLRMYVSTFDGVLYAAFMLLPLLVDALTARLQLVIQRTCVYTPSDCVCV